MQRARLKPRPQGCGGTEHVLHDQHRGHVEPASARTRQDVSLLSGGAARSGEPLRCLTVCSGPRPLCDLYRFVVRVAALYDIHGNDAALAAVLAEVDALGADLVVVGGDVAGGPFPREAADAVRLWAFRQLLLHPRQRRARARRGAPPLDAGTARIDPADTWSSRTHWAAEVLDQEQLNWMGALPPLASVEIDGLGDVLFCHGSPL